MPASTDTGVALSQRATFGMFVPPSTPSSPNTNNINREFHAAENLLGVEIPMAGIFCSFDTTWAGYRPASPSGHQWEWDDFADATTPRTLNVCWEPKKTSGAVSMTAITSGAFDTHINQMVAGFAAYPGQVIVRWGHEMNGNWYPWSMGYAGTNKGITAVAEYIAAWKYIHAKVKAADATVKMMFCPNGEDVGGTAMEAYYPGDSWVDLLGLDSYNNYRTNPDTGWMTPYQTYQPMYDRLDALNASMDIHVGETGCIDGVAGRSKADWITQLFAETRLSRIKAVIYFNAQGGKDWRFNTSSSAATSAATAYQSVLGKVTYAGPPAPDLTIPADTNYAIIGYGNAKPTYRIVKSTGEIQWGDGTNDATTRAKRAANGLLDIGPALKLANATAPAQQGNGPCIYGTNGALYVLPSSGAAFPLKRPVADLHSLKALSHADPSTCTQTTSLTGGVVWFVRLYVHEATTLSNVKLCVTTAAVTPGTDQNWVGLYNTSFSQLAVSADVGSSLTSTGDKTLSFTTPYSATAGTYLVAILLNGSTVAGLARNGLTGASPYVHNFGLSAPNQRFMSFTTTGQTTLTSSYNSANVNGNTSAGILVGLG